MELFNYNIWFDIAAITMMLSILFCYFIRKSISIQQNTIFITIVFAILDAAVASLITIVLEGKNRFLVVISNYVLAFDDYIVAALWLLYIMSTINFKVYFTRLLYIFVGGEFLLIIALLTLNAFTGCFFYIDSSAVYHAGTNLFILYLIYFIYISISIGIIFIYRKFISKERLLQVPILIITSIIFVSIEFAHPELSMIQFCIALNAMFMFFSIMDPQNFYENRNGILNENAFTAYLNPGFKKRKNITLIGVCIHNIDIIRNLLSEDKIEKFEYDIMNSVKDLKKHLFAFKIGDGIFVVAVENKKKVEKIYRTMNQIAENARSGKYTQIIISSTICKFSTPEHASSIDEVYYIIQKISQQGNSNNLRTLNIKDIDLDKIKYNMSISNLIKRAEEENKLSLNFQPIYSVREKQFNNVEVLVRLRDDNSNPVPPDVFIPIAEMDRSILDITDFVLTETCRIITEYHLFQYNLRHVEINLSVMDLMQSNFAKKVGKLFDSYKISPSFIIFEITETYSNAFNPTVIENIHKLSLYGFNFALDDFGTGHSSLKRILDLPISILKIDKSIVQNVTRDNERKFRILETSVNLAKKINAQIVAEGVETQEVMDILEEMNCDFIQGYLKSKPLPLSDYLSFTYRNMEH